MDLFPTYLHLAKSRPWVGEKEHFDGISFHKRLLPPYQTLHRTKPIFSTFKVQNEHVDVTTGNDSTNFAVRKGRWKLIRDVQGGCTPCLFDFSTGYNDESMANNVAERQPELVKQLREEYLEWFLQTTRMKAKQVAKSAGVVSSAYTIKGFKANGPSEVVTDYTFGSSSAKKYVKLENNIKFDVNRLDFTFTARITPARLVPGRWAVIAMRKGTWEFRLTPTGQLQVLVFDKNGNASYTTTGARLKAGVEYDIAFSIYSFKSLNSVVRIYARGAKEDVKEPERLYQLARRESFKGLRSNNNTIFLGADPSSTRVSFEGRLKAPRIYHSPLRRGEMGYGMRWWGNVYD